LVEITGETQLIVCLVDCVQKICDDHTHVNAASIANEAWRARCGLWITSANENCVQSSLDIASYQLTRVSFIRLAEYGVNMCFLPLGGNTNQPRRGSRWLTFWICVLGRTTRCIPHVMISTCSTLQSCLDQLLISSERIDGAYRDKCQPHTDSTA